MKKKLQLQQNLFYAIFKIVLLTGFLITALQGFTQNVFYNESYDHFMNPDRGFYFPYDSEYWYDTPGNFLSLNENQLRDRRTGNPFSPGFNSINPSYETNNSVILRHYVLDDFRSSYIDSSFLSKIQTDFNRARNAGVRMVLRFSYILNTPLCGEGESPPNCNGRIPTANVCVCEYGDASEFWVTRHIQQLAPYFRNNEDVIMLVQNGFIGVWGEQYYTDYFGDSSPNGKGYLDSDDWQARINVLKALLDALPESRMVQVRYPQMRYKFLQQHPQYANRIGFQNDCFLSSPDDVGTYLGYDMNDSTNKDFWRAYANNEGDYVAVGGETCADGNNPYNNCASQGGQAVAEMELMNWSFLNSAYSYYVNNDWEDGNCLDEIKTRLGYRFVLNNGQFQEVAQQGDIVNFSLNLDNNGFAAPFNKRTLFMMLKNNSTGAFLNPIEVYGDDADSRRWTSGNHTLNLRFNLPASVSVGDYSMYLHIADLSKRNQTTESIRNNPAYSIRLANKLSNNIDVWDANTGYNNLNHTISIQNTPPPPPPPMGNNCIDIDGNFTDWNGIIELRTANSTELSTLKAADDAGHIYLHLSGTLRNHYQIFIDTDGNSVRSNNNDSEYLSSNWQQTGFNYMLENGTLFKYVSTNSWDWAWSPISAIPQNEAANGLELMVPKYLFNALSNANISIGAKTLNAAWSGTAYLPASGNFGASYQPFSSNPCVEPDVCIMIDGNSNEWQTLTTTYSNNTATLKKLTVTDNAQDLFVLIEGNLSILNHTPQIFFDTDNNTNGSNEFRATDWSNSGFNYMMEFNTLHKYVGDGNSWDWQFLGEIERNFGNNNVLEFRIPKSTFQEPLSSTIKVAGYYYNSNWIAAGKLPANSATGISYQMSSNNSCGQIVQKTVNNEKEIHLNTKYVIASTPIENVKDSSNKRTNNNCITVDGNANEWNNLTTYAYAKSGSLTHIKVADNGNELLFYVEGGLDVNNQIYLNSDVNSSTLNRYNNSQWEYAGFNYLIENSELFVYNGDGVSWSWSSIGTVSHSITENVLEISVQKNQLSNLSNSISFAASSLNVDYHETGAIPEGNASLNYLMGTKDLCNIKPACLTINGDTGQWLHINHAVQHTGSSNLQSFKISDGSELLYILLEGNMDVYQQVFIDTDNDALGNNEYTDSNWSLTGFNYLIDQGDLFVYQGNGVSWDWLPIGAVNMITSKYGIELSVQKYLLGNITGTIQIAASSFDANWAETSFIPVAEQAFSYEPSTNNLSLFFHQNGINFHQAYDVLKSSANLINSTTNERYKAGQLIQLNNGFSTPPLTNFSAYIEECE